MNIFKRIFGKKEEPNKKAAQEECQDLDHDRIREFINTYHGVDLLDDVNLGAILYKLYKVDGDAYDVYVIQVKYRKDPKEYCVRMFYDPDTEYAENCAREAFDYLTKEI